MFIQVHIIARLPFFNKKLFDLQPLSHTYDITCKIEGNAADLLMVTFTYSSIWYLFYEVYSTVLYYKDKENEPWLAKVIARAISQSLKQRTIWHKGLNACMYITSDMKVGHYTEPWPTTFLCL